MTGPVNQCEVDAAMTAAMMSDGVRLLAFVVHRAARMPRLSNKAPIFLGCSCLDRRTRRGQSGGCLEEFVRGNSKDCDGGSLIIVM